MKRSVLWLSILGLLAVSACVADNAGAADNVSAQAVNDPCAFAADFDSWIDLVVPNSNRQTNLRNDLRSLNSDVLNSNQCNPPTTTTTTTIPTTTTTVTETTTTVPTTTTTAPGSCTTHQGDLNANVAGMVIENVCMIDGTLICNAANVTFRNSSSNIHSGWAIQANQGCTGLRVAGVDIFCNHVQGTNGFAQDFGFVGQDIELRNMNIHGCENGVFIDNGVKLFDSYIYDPLCDTCTPGSDPHSDGVQLWAGASDVVIQGNIIDYRGDTTSAIISGGFEPDPNFGFSSDILITNNVLGGGAATLYIPAKEDCCGEAATHVYDTVFVTNNQFMPEHAYFFCDGDETRLGAWSGNIRTDTGAILATCD